MHPAYPQDAMKGNPTAWLILAPLRHMRMTAGATQSINSRILGYQCRKNVKNCIYTVFRNILLFALACFPERDESWAAHKLKLLVQPCILHAWTAHHFPVHQLLMIKQILSTNK